MKANGIGMPERKIYEVEPIDIPVPSLVPNFVPEEWLVPDEEEVPA